MKLRKDLIDYVYFAIFGVFLVLFVTGQFSQVTGTTLVVIDNADPNSMFPTYFQGDLFVIYKDTPQDIEIGDVIVYQTGSGQRVIHRVIDIVVDTGEYFFRVKGDDPVTNPRPDNYSGGTFIPFDAVLGKVVARLPYIGHISLAMQQNIIVQLLVYLVAIGLSLAIIFWPDDEDEEEDDYYDLSREALENLKAKLAGKLQHLKFILTKSNYKILAWILIGIILLAGFIPFFLPTFLPMPTGFERGVNSIDYNNNKQLNEQVVGGDAEFYNVFVNMYDDGTLWNHISGYTMMVKLDNGTVIDMTKWNTLRPIKGEFTVGGSITIPLDTYLQLETGTQLIVEIIVHVDKFSGQMDLDPFYGNLTVS